MTILHKFVKNVTRVVKHALAYITNNALIAVKMYP